MILFNWLVKRYSKSLCNKNILKNSPFINNHFDYIIKDDLLENDFLKVKLADQILKEEKENN